MNLLNEHLTELIRDAENAANPYYSIENVVITKHHKANINKMIEVDYTYDTYSKVDRAWVLLGRKGHKKFKEEDLKSYFRDARIDEILN